MYLVLDIGGSTTDMSIWESQTNPVEKGQLSIRLAGSLVSAYVHSDNALDAHLARKWDNWTPLAGWPLATANAVFSAYMKSRTVSDDEADALVSRLIDGDLKISRDEGTVGAVLPTVAATVVASILYCAGVWIRRLHSKGLIDASKLTHAFLCGKGASFAAWDSIKARAYLNHFLSCGMRLGATGTTTAVHVIDFANRKQEVGRGLLVESVVEPDPTQKIPVLETGSMNYSWESEFSQSDFQAVRSSFREVLFEDRALLHGFLDAIVSLDSPARARDLRDLFLSAGWNRIQSKTDREAFLPQLNRPLLESEPKDAEPILVEEIRRALRAALSPSRA